MCVYVSKCESVCKCEYVCMPCYDTYVYYLSYFNELLLSTRVILFYKQRHKYAHHERDGDG